MKFKMMSLFEEFDKTARVGIRHPFQIAQLDGPGKFIGFMDYLKYTMNGKINSAEIDITEKVDGFGIRFGCTDGDIFIESSYSGLIFDQGHFTEYAREKNYKGEGLKIFQGFDKMLKIFQEDKDISSILRKHQPVKLIGECQYTPAGRRMGNKISFVATEYDIKKLGNLATIVLFYSVTPNKFQSVMKELKSLNRSDIKFDDPIINYKFTINILPSLNKFSKELEEFENTLQKKYPDLEYDDILHLPLKRKAGVPKEFYIELKSAKTELINFLMNWGKKIEEEISKPIRGKFGDVAEGVVIKFNNGMTIKITTDAFNASKVEFNKMLLKKVEKS